MGRNALQVWPIRFAVLLFAVLLAGGCQPRGQTDDAVFAAVRNNDASRIGQYLAEGGDPNRLNGNGDSLLYVASGARGGGEVVQALLRGGADIDAATPEGRTALHIAAGWCDITILQILLDAGADPRIADDRGETPIDAVCAEPVDMRHDVIAMLSRAGG